MQKGRVRISGAATVSCHVSRSCVVRSSASVHAPRRTRLAIHAPHLETVAFAFIAEPTKCRAPLDFRFFVWYIRSFRSFARSVPYLLCVRVRFTIVAFSWSPRVRHTRRGRRDGQTASSAICRFRGFSRGRRETRRSIGRESANRIYTRVYTTDRSPFSYFSRLTLYGFFCY